MSLWLRTTMPPRTTKESLKSAQNDPKNTLGALGALPARLLNRDEAGGAVFFKDLLVLC
jgi:hypothetical protein